jgi:hypothetical protein
MIGNVDDARQALTDPYLSPFSDEGCARVVYLIDNVIYKVDLADGGNDSEWANYQAFSGVEMPEFIAIPEMSRYEINGETVIAAEYIKGMPTGECWDRQLDFTCLHTSEPCLSDRMESEIRRFIGDLAWGNVIVSDGRYYIVDLEC